jgi:hypothetical protein
MEQLRSWLREHYLPVILVAATPAAEAACISRNGLTVVDVLRTQSTVTGFNGGRLPSLQRCTDPPPAGARMAHDACNAPPPPPTPV